MLSVGDTVIINELAVKGLPMRVGSRAVIIDKLYSPNYQFVVEFDDGDTSPIKGVELNDLTNELAEYMGFIFTGNKVTDERTGEIVEITKANYLTKQADVRDKNMIESIAGFNSLQPIHIETGKDEIGYFEQLGLQIGKLVDKKQKAYGDSVTKCYQIMKVLLQDYYNENDRTYTFPESLLPQMLLDIRKIDKMNRRFSNPDGDLMGENPFQDDVGYSMLGVRMIESLNK